MSGKDMGRFAFCAFMATWPVGLLVYSATADSSVDTASQLRSIRENYEGAMRSCFETGLMLGDMARISKPIVWRDGKVPLQAAEACKLSRQEFIAFTVAKRIGGSK